MPRRAVSIRRAINVSAALVTPFVLQAVAGIIVHEFRIAMSPQVRLGATGVNIVAGFMFVVYEARFWALIAGPFYFLLMFYALIAFSMGLAGAMYGDWL